MRVPSPRNGFSGWWIVPAGFATVLWMVVAFPVIHGLARNVRGPVIPAMRAKYFGPQMRTDVSRETSR